MLTAHMHLLHKYRFYILVLIIAGVVHGFNSFGFPYYENDEGVYLSQAWSIVHKGALAPYTYWYDHAPAGWILTSAWLVLTRGVFTFGFSLNSGRVWMLVIHLLSCIWLFSIGKRLTGREASGILAVLIFSLSPLGIYFQRRLLLDNIMICWVLLSFALLVGKTLTFRRVIFSAITLGIGILTKENAIFFVPGLFGLLLVKTDRRVRILWSLFWVLLLGGIVSSYVLFAVLKGEFFAFGTWLGGSSPHVSLLETLRFQASRTSSGGFAQNVRLWMRYDPFIIAGGAVSTVVLIGVAWIKKVKSLLAVAILIAGGVLFLARGGIVIEFYILPLLPLLALAIGIVLTYFPRKLVFGGITLVYLGWYLTQTFVSNGPIMAKAVFLSDQTQGQIKAVDWIRDYVPNTAFIAIDNYAYLDLHDASNQTGKTFPNAHWYWKVGQDPAIRETILQDNPENISYILKTSQMEQDMNAGSVPLVRTAFLNSHLVQSLPSDGWNADIYATIYPKQILARTWESYKRTFVLDDGSTRDPQRPGVISSEAQSYTLLRSVWMKDRETFDLAWKWTRDHIQQPAGNFAWKWQDGRIVDAGTAADADTDIATALLFAYKVWGDGAYLEQANTVIHAIWTSEVVDWRGMPVMTAGNWARGQNQAIVNPSYFAPASYRMFADVDREHNWKGMVDSAYVVIAECTDNSLGTGGMGVLPPNWCALAPDGTIATSSVEGVDSVDFSYDAVRTIWRLSADLQWYQEPRAEVLLTRYGELLVRKWEADKRLLVGYTHTGQPWEQYESAFSSAIYIQAIRRVSPFAAADIYSKTVMAKLYEQFEGKTVTFWEDPLNYYTQNWAWFGTGLYTDNLPNLWVK